MAYSCTYTGKMCINRRAILYYGFCRDETPSEPRFVCENASPAVHWESLARARKARTPCMPSATAPGPAPEANPAAPRTLPAPPVAAACLALGLTVGADGLSSRWRFGKPSGLGLGGTGEALLALVSLRHQNIANMSQSALCIP